jgi:hypothetical protein
MSELYKSVLLRMSNEKFQEHKEAKKEQSWEEYFEVERVRA